MPFVSKLSPEQWAEARRLRAAGQSYAAIASSFGIAATTVRERARKEAWPSPRGDASHLAATARQAGRGARRRPPPTSAPSWRCASSASSQSRSG